MSGLRQSPGLMLALWAKEKGWGAEGASFRLSTWGNGRLGIELHYPDGKARGVTAPPGMSDRNAWMFLEDTEQKFRAAFRLWGESRLTGELVDSTVCAVPGCEQYNAGIVKLCVVHRGYRACEDCRGVGRVLSGTDTPAMINCPICEGTALNNYCEYCDEECTGDC